MRPTTIRDARKLNLVPSVTTVMDILEKQALVRWFKEQTALAAWEVNRYEPKEKWVETVLRKSNEVSEKAADIGTEIHDSLECASLGERYPAKYATIVGRVNDEVEKAFGNHQWVAEKSFCHPLGFGGKVDLHSAEGIIIDYKTKETLFSANGKLKKLWFPNHVRQLAAYDKGLGLNASIAANVFVDYAGNVHIHEWTPAEMKEGWEIFEATLNLWKLLKKYDPAT